MNMQLFMNRKSTRTMDNQLTKKPHKRTNRKKKHTKKTPSQTLIFCSQRDQDKTTQTLEQKEIYYISYA